MAEDLVWLVLRLVSVVHCVEWSAGPAVRRCATGQTPLHQLSVSQSAAAEPAGAC